MGTGILQKSYALYTDASISVAYVSIKKEQDWKKASKKLTAPPKLAPFYDKRLKSTGAKELSASVVISDNMVLRRSQHVQKCPAAQHDCGAQMHK